MTITHDLYIALSLMSTAALLLICGLMFLFIDVPQNQSLGNYRKARNMLAVAYLFFAALNIIELIFVDASQEIDISLNKMITLNIAVSQAPLITLALLSLLEVRFPGWLYIVKKTTPAIAMIIVVSIVYIFLPNHYFEKAFFILCGLYALLLVYYTHLFMSAYRLFRFRLNNYFSDHQAEQMKWVKFSFFAALFVGLLALLSAVYASLETALAFTVVFCLFYPWFAIRFINYAHRFHVIENAMEIEPIEISKAPISIDDRKLAEYAALDIKIDKWIAEKKFAEKGILIETLALAFGTNRNHLSVYFNSYKGKSFNAWINELKIEEAKNQMLKNPNMSLIKIAEMAGYTDKSLLIRNFMKQTGISPTEWKQKKLAE